jgi:hypothetical protein
MDAKKLSLILNIIAALKEYGAPAIRRIIDELADKGEPTLGEIDALSNLLKTPESYFDKG